MIVPVPNEDEFGASESLHLGEFAHVCEAGAVFLARLGGQRG